MKIKTRQLLSTAIMLLLVFHGLVFQAAAQDEEIVISGRVFTIEGAGLPGVTLVFSNNREINVTVTDAEGNYTQSLEYGWTGTVTPSKSGYTFDPPHPYYENLTSPLLQDYTAHPAPFVISGRVGTPGGTGVGGVILTFSDLEGNTAITTADFNGFYRLKVPHFRTGTVTPSKAGYEFVPGIITYDNITTDHTGENYTAVTVRPAVSGRVTDSNGLGIPAVTLTFTGSGTTQTDADGRYIHTVKRRWSGTVTLSKTGYTFSPPGAAYNRVKTDLTGQDYTAAGFYPFITGSVVSTESTGIPGVRLDFAGTGETGNTPTYTYTNAGGRYNFAVPAGWTGSVIPSKPVYTFLPGGIEYSNVIDNQYLQDYSAHKILLFISGTIIGIPEPEGVTLEFSGLGETAETDMTGYFEYPVPYGWSGKLTPKKSGYLFLPASQAYSPVTFDWPHQVFQTIPGSMTLTLRASRETTGSLFIKRDYGKLSVSVEIEGTIPIAGYFILRKEPGVQYEQIGEIPGEALQSGGTYLFIDKHIQRDKIYTYQAAAIHESGLKIKESGEKDI